MALIDDIMNGTPRQTVITFPNSEYSDIDSGFHGGTLSIERVLNSNTNATIGECNADKFECTLEDISDITGVKIQVKQIIGESDDNEVILFTGYVDSARQVKNRAYRKIVAYDELYYKADINVASWYNNLFRNAFAVTMAIFRTSLLQYVNIPYDSNAVLINDSMIIKKTIDTKSLRFDDVLRLICEANACYGHMSNSGVLEFIYLSQMTTTDVSNNYRKSDTSWEEYECATIDRLDIADEDGEVLSIGTGDNAYSISDNWLLWGLGNQATSVLNNIFTELNQINYTPCDIKLIYSNPLIQVGSIITFDNVSTYCFSTSYNGVQMFSQTIRADGDEYLDGAKSDSLNSEVSAIKTRLDNLANRSASTYFVQVYAADDVATITPNTSITLYAKVADTDGNDCTGDFPEECFHWIRQSANISADETFNLADYTGSELEVDYEDNVANVTYICEVRITTNGDTDTSQNVEYIATDTYYNIVMSYDNKFTGGTDLTNDYGVKQTVYIEDGSIEWVGKGLQNQSLAGKHALVRMCGNNLISFGYNTNIIQWWDSSQTSHSSTGVNYLDFIYANGTLYRLSESEGTYSIYSMTDPETEDTLIYSTEDFIKSWVTDGTNHYMLIDNVVYKVTDSSTRTSVQSALQTYTLTKLALNSAYLVVIGSLGIVSYCSLTDTSTWTVKNAGFHDDLIDIFPYGIYFYIINAKGKLYRGTTKYSAIGQFDANPISIQIIDIYTIVTYVNRIALSIENVSLNFSTYEANFGTTSQIRRIVQFNGGYVILANNSLIYKDNLSDSEYTVLSPIPFENRTDIVVSEDGTKLYMLGYVYANYYNQNFISYTTDLSTWQSLLDPNYSGGNSTLNSVAGNYNVSEMNSLSRVGNYLVCSFGYYSGGPANLPVVKVNLSDNSVTVAFNLQQKGAYSDGNNGVFGIARYTNSNYGWGDFSTDNLTTISPTFSIGGYAHFEPTPALTFRKVDDGLIYMNGRYSAIQFYVIHNDGSYDTLRVSYKGTTKDISAVIYVNGVYLAMCHDGYAYGSTNGQYWHRIIEMPELAATSAGNYSQHKVYYADVFDDVVFIYTYAVINGTTQYKVYIGGVE